VTTVTRTIHFTRKARRKRVVLGPDAPKPELPGRVPRVARLMALAIKYDRLLRKSVVADMSELARLCQVTQSPRCPTGTCSSWMRQARRLSRSSWSPH
jgi:hypothetical protein